jgi:hypothetical protein
MAAWRAEGGLCLCGSTAGASPRGLEDLQRIARFVVWAGQRLRSALVALESKLARAADPLDGVGWSVHGQRRR